ncbi:MAG: hypothetical protein RQ745_05695 [Longimicrobiales bacterium]|nr:hypothetical protein [Longimicrobiales bacterium]
MTMRRLALLLRTTLVVPLLLATPLAGQQAVPLTFDWIPGMRARVTTTTEQSRTTPMGGGSIRTVASSLLTTEAHPRGLLLRHRRGELIEAEASGTTGIEGAGDVARVLAEAPHDLLVDRSGRLLEVRRDAETRARLRAALREMLAPASETSGSEDLTGALDRMLSDEALDADLRQSWSSAVELWIDAGLAVGETVTSVEEAPFPMLENRAVMMEMETTLEGYIPCVEGGAPESCVRLRVVSTPDAKDVRPMMEEMLARNFGGSVAGMPLELEGFVQTSIVEATVEPGTLVPHNVIVHSVADLQLTLMGQSVPTHQEMTSVTTWAWEAR